MTDAETIRHYMTQNQDVAPTEREFDLALFQELNREYRSRPVVPAPRELDDASRRVYAKQRADLLNDRIGLGRTRVLEVGCGAGDVCAAVARLSASVVGVDITDYPTWDAVGGDGITFAKGDLSDPVFLREVQALGPFDRIYSLVVWEHVEHPFAMLEACHALLAPQGKMYLRANLYRSAVASHLYRHVFFPWPHLLFQDRVFSEFFRAQGLPEEVPAWLNKLTYAQYLLYFDLIGLDVQRRWLRKRQLDEAFYERFRRQLSPYPRFDLELDFLDVILMRRPTGPLAPPTRAARRIEHRLRRLSDDIRGRLKR